VQRLTEADCRSSAASQLTAARYRRRGVFATLRENGERLLAAVALAAIAAGAFLHIVGLPTAGDAVWAGAVAVILVPLTLSVVRTLARGDLGVDAIALVAMIGALALGEYLAGAVIALMLSGGNALEAAATRRARRELRALLERAPSIAHRRRGDVIEEVPVDAVAAGDVVVIRRGEVIPVDGIVAEGQAVVDESTLTGESLPVSRTLGQVVRSGSANAGEPFDVRATRPASESAYAALVRLVRTAETQRAPFVRLADRYAAFFLPFTLVIAGLAWALAGDPTRALAVLVVATPCPLILAAPIALISGVSRAAREGIIVKGGAVIEKLGDTKSVLLDKTGTLTHGTPVVERIVTLDHIDADELVRLTASLDQLSAHVLAEAIVHDTQRRGLGLSLPREVVEQPGQGVDGRVDGRRVTIGSAAWLEERGYSVEGAARALDEAGDSAGRARILVGVDGRLAGIVVMSDHLRTDAEDLVEQLREVGVKRIAMVTGDSEEVAREIGRQVGIEDVYAELSPEAKLDVVRSLQSDSDTHPVLMVGDGVNDAPALALAEVGIAIGAAGATVSAETADAVVTVDRIDRVARAIGIGRRSLAIARQSVVFGLGLSILAMGFAAFGYISPVGGALLQEVIDVAVILNALRALTD
jgi:heavy metal translocating P-type ATPase